MTETIDKDKRVGGMGNLGVKNTMERKLTYSELLQDGRWQILRLEVFNRDQFTCVKCGAKAKDGAQVHVHHIKYFKGFKPWEYDPKFLETLCSACHRSEHFGPVVAPNVPTKEVEELPFSETEAKLLRILLLYGHLPIKPQNPPVPRNYSLIYEFIICELARVNLRLENPELRQMYDTIAGNYYNAPGYTPDVEQFLNTENDTARAFARYTVESFEPISSGWEKFGVKIPTETELAPVEAINMVFGVRITVINQQILDAKDELRGLDNPDVEMKALQKIAEIQNLKKEVIKERMAWTGY